MLSYLVVVYYFKIRIALNSTLFPYTTLFRSRGAGRAGARELSARRVVGPWRDAPASDGGPRTLPDRKSTRLNSSHQIITYAVSCLKKKNRMIATTMNTQSKATESSSNLRS